jgi:hypothetical protein
MVNRLLKNTICTPHRCMVLANPTHMRTHAMRNGSYSGLTMVILERRSWVGPACPRQCMLSNCVWKQQKVKIEKQTALSRLRLTSFKTNVTNMSVQHIHINTCTRTQASKTNAHTCTLPDCSAAAPLPGCYPVVPRHCPPHTHAGAQAHS